MNDLHTTERNGCPPPWLGGLPTPAKNHYFYGMLLTAANLSREQDYNDAKRWLVNRLTLGTGVLAGLRFTVSDAPPRVKSDKRWRIHLEPGVAVDGYGREIVVPAPHDPGGQSGARGEEPAAPEIAWVKGHDRALASDPDFLSRLLFDGELKPAADIQDKIQRLGGSPLSLVVELGYRSQPTDLMPVKAGSCARDCVPGTTREEFRVRVRLARDFRDPPGAPQEELERWNGSAQHHPSWHAGGSLPDIFPTEPPESIRHRQHAQQNQGLVEPVLLAPSDDPEWVPIGVIELAVDGDNDSPRLTFQEPQPYYRQLFSNDALSRLVFGLAERVDEAARVRILTYDGADGACGEGQSGKVYYQLHQPLKVKILSGTDDTPQDLSSIRVQFDVLSKDGGTLSYVDSQGQQLPVQEPLPVSDEGLAEVYWTFSHKPGPHTVAARVVTAPPVGGPNEPDPPFHPGSQVLFHATAVSTAPTIVGMVFDHWHQRCGKGYEWHYGHAVLRVFYSRRIDRYVRDAQGTDRDVHGDAQGIARWLRVWRMFGYKPARSTRPGHHQSVTIPVGPLKLEIHPHRPPLAVGADDDPEACWFAEYKIPDLLEHLCEQDTLRVLVMIQPGDVLVAPAFEPYPQAQRVDAAFEGSFVAPKCRQYLWDPTQPADQVTQWAESLDRSQWPTLEVTAEQQEGLQDMWHRFQPRERSLPSGAGAEGGEFHKAFELKLPRCQQD